MTWSDFYLVCFLLGFMLSVASLLLGHVHIHIHLTHGAGFNLGGHGGAHGGHGGGQAHGGADAELSPFNIATFAAFLAWFGGSGYVVTRYTSYWHLAALSMAALFGLAGAALIFWLMSKLVHKNENLDPADYEMVGVLGRVVSPIRESGTGEVVYVQGGTRHAAGARSDDGTAVEKGTEVVVTRYEKGIAYVRRWEDLAEAEAEKGLGREV